MSVTGKVIAVTGGASGMGLALAQVLARRGAKQVQAVAESNDHVLGCEVDITKPETITSWLDSTVQKFGRLDGAANVAGICIGGDESSKPWHENESEGHHQTLAVNLYGLENCLRGELSRMQAGASIVNVASVAGVRPGPPGKAG
ncbi:putative oxidoreductase [Colletotrichum sublineola]|uniref:Putative oxidoreductase n=1 Tax=Colletotrichum sublineola TaxID=1173701 RepID=A0A066XVI2_COLSU|nr:putative oxidoreductase [Colletotrichum sublineola]